MKDRRGFTLIELLATITLLGIIMLVAIPNVSKLIEKSKTSKNESNTKTLLMAGKSYAQANKEKLPKSIGETKNVYASELRTAGFLKDELIDDKNQSCMEKSFVAIYMKNKGEYNYTAKLCCGTSCEDDLHDNPDIEIKFKNVNGNILEGKTYDPNDPNAVSDQSNYLVRNIDIKYTGNKDNDEIKLSSYSYVVLVSYVIRDASNNVTGREKYTEVVNSGSIKANDLKEKTVSLDLANYIDVTREYYIRVVAKAYNEIYGYNELIKQTLYKDPAGPTCGTVKIYENNGTEVSASNLEWTNKPRKAVIECNSSVGCKKKKYTQVFTESGNSDELGKVDSNGVGYVQIEDIQGRQVSCPINLKIDTEGPKITVNMYKWINNNQNPNYTSIPKDRSGKSVEYTAGSWSDKYVYTEPHSTDNSSEEVSYMYTTKGETTDETDKKAKHRNIKAEGKSQIEWKACDKLGNCSSSGFIDVNICTNCSNPDNLIKPTYDLYIWDGTGNLAEAIKNKTLENYKPNTWTNTNVVVHFKHPDREKFDISFHYHRSGGPEHEDVPDDILVIDQEGVTEWQFMAKYAGQTFTYSNYDYVKVKIDRTPPTFKVTLRKDSKDLDSTTATNYEYSGEINDNFTLLLSNVADKIGSQNGSGVNKNYEFSYNAPYLTEFSTDVAGTEVRTLTNNSNSRDITSYGKRVLWITLTDNAGNEVQAQIKVNVRNTIINGNRFICDNNKLGVYHITTCPNDSLCYFDKLNGLTNSNQVDRTKLKNGIPNSCVKSKCVKSSGGANCRNGASTSGTTVNRTLAYGTSLTAAETTTSGWSYSTNYGCYISSSLLSDSCSSSSGSGSSGDDVPSSGSSCHQYKRCAAAGCASTSKQCSWVGGFKYKGNYDSGGVCETKYKPSRCGHGTTCTDCQYQSCTYVCNYYRRASVCGCEY